MALLSGAPMCVVVLDARGRLVGCNDTFEQSLGPVEKFADLRFNDIASSEAARHKLGAAIESVGRGEALKVSVTDVEMELKGEGGTPLSGFFDWSVGLVSAALSNILDKSARYEGGRGLILMGEPCSEQTVRQRAKDSETADFIQNAPIPLQSTDCKGVIQWVRGQYAGVVQSGPKCIIVPSNKFQKVFFLWFRNLIPPMGLSISSGTKVWGSHEHFFFKSYFFGGKSFFFGETAQAFGHLPLNYASRDLGSLTRYIAMM